MLQDTALINQYIILWWEIIECTLYYIRAVFEPAGAAKSLTSFLTSLLRWHKSIANLTSYAWPTPSKLIVLTCKRHSCSSACETSIS